MSTEDSKQLEAGQKEDSGCKVSGRNYIINPIDVQNSFLWTRFADKPRDVVRDEHN